MDQGKSPIPVKLNKRSQLACRTIKRIEMGLMAGLDNLKMEAGKLASGLFLYEIRKDSARRSGKVRFQP